MKPRITALSAFLLLAFSLISCRVKAAGADARFAAMDKNGDGVLTEEEVGKARLFSRADTNGDGKITKEEAEAFSGGRQARGGEGKRAAARPSGAETVAYASMKGVDPNLLSLDLYPAEKAGSPVVIMVHGGGWANGDKAHKDIGPAKAGFFNGLGFTFVSVNYRLAPAVMHPAQVQDVARAVDWVFKNIAQHNGDPAQVWLMGHSAGAHLVSLVATDERYLGALGDKLSQIKGVIALDSAAFVLDGNTTYGPKLEALYGRAFGENRAKWSDAGPLVHVAKGKGIPPFLVFASDREISMGHAEEFVNVLKKAGVPAAAVEAKGTEHSTLNDGIGQPGNGPSKLIQEFIQGKDPSGFPSSI